MTVTGRRMRRLRRGIWLLAAAILGVQAVFIVLNLWDRRGPWDLELEYGYPALLDAALLAGDAALCLAFWLVDGSRLPASHHRREWLAAGLVITWLVVDGSLAIHERVTPTVQPWLDPFGVTAPAWLWVVPYAPLMAVGALTIRSLARTISRQDRLAGLAPVLTLACWGGAVVVEPVGLALWQESRPCLYTLAIVVEETLEIVGALLLLVAFARYGVLLLESMVSREEQAVAGAR